MTKKFTVIWKIINSCNFACKYCHFNDEMHSKPGTMSLELAELFIKKVSESPIYKDIQFTFHGGEPLLVGLDYFEKITSYQKRYLEGKTYSNTFQTNGSLINKELIQFAHKNQFHFSVSLDGPKQINDANRVFKNGNGTYDIIMKNLELLNTNRQKFSLLAVYSDLMKNSDEMFTFFKSLKGLTLIDFLPMRANHETTFQLNYGYFLINMFDKWFNDPECDFDIRILSGIVKSLTGLPFRLCTFTETCVTHSNIFTLDPYGNAYPCDNKTYNNFLLGNIQTNSIDDLMVNYPIRERLASLETKKNQNCLFCKWYLQCHGGCPDHYDAKTKQNAYCLDYKNVFLHIQNVLRNYMILDDYGNVNLDKISGIQNKNLVNTIKRHHYFDPLKKCVQ
jgi:uncharacterized protein